MDRGDSWMVDINVISNNTIVNNCFIIFYELLATCITKSLNVRFINLKKTREDVGDSTGDVSF